MLRTRSAATSSVRRSDLIKRCLFSTLSRKAAIAQASVIFAGKIENNT